MRNQPASYLAPTEPRDEATTSFEAHVDILPALMGYPLTDALIITITRADGNFDLQTSPLTLDGVRQALQRWDCNHACGAAAIHIIAATDETFTTEEVLREALHGVCDILGEDVTIGQNASLRIAAGWASPNEFALMNEDWRLGTTHGRPSQAGTLGVRLLGRPLPAPNRQSYLHRFKHTGDPADHHPVVSLAQVHATVEPLIRLYTERPAYALLSLKDRAVLLPGSADRTIQPYLLSLIDRGNANEWTRVWHGIAARSSEATFATAYAMAAYAAWVKGEGMMADAYLTYAKRAKDPTNFVVALDAAVSGGFWRESDLATIIAAL